MYLFALAIRTFVVFLLYPLLSRTGAGLSWQGAVVASWGGLRGAVGLALSLVMKSEMSNNDGTRIAIQPNPLSITQAPGVDPVAEPYSLSPTPTPTPARHP